METFVLPFELSNEIMGKFQIPRGEFSALFILNLFIHSSSLMFV